VAIGISSSATSSAGGPGGFAVEAQRAAIAARRREALEAREEPATDAAARSEREAAAPAQRIGETAAPREARQERIRLSQVTEESPRPAIAAYLCVERATPAAPSFGELLGIDIYV
jgi:hypothetical protein